MSIIQLFATAIRVFGLYVLFLAVMQISYYGVATSHMGDYLSDGGATYDAAQLIWSMLYVLAAILMIVMPTKMAHWLMLGDLSDGSTGSLKEEGLVVSALVVVGIIIIAGAIPNMINSSVWIWYTHMGQVNDRMPIGETAEYVIALMTALIEFSIGLYLTFGAKGLQQLLFKIRRGGIG